MANRLYTGTYIHEPLGFCGILAYVRSIFTRTRGLLERAHEAGVSSPPHRGCLKLWAAYSFALTGSVITFCTGFHGFWQRHDAMQALAIHPTGMTDNLKYHTLFRVEKVLHVWSRRQEERCFFDGEHSPFPRHVTPAVTRL